MIKPVAIEKGARRELPLDYEFLRSEGIEWIQRLAGERWTDFNLHDPGVTILEQLCFAITELAYRTDFPIEDLLANEKGFIDYARNAFYLKEDILTTNPVTINDYRKVIIDEIEEVQNAWLYPLRSAHSDNVLSGLYKVYIQVKPYIGDKMLVEYDTIANEIAEKVRHCYISRRNLCEDIISEIVILKPVKIGIEAEVLIGDNQITEEVLANIYHYLESSLNIPVRYFTEKELLEQGYAIEDIYDGPLLKNGFIPDSELHERKVVVDPAELIKSVSQIEGILSVKKLKINYGQITRHNKPLVIPDNSFPLLDIPSSEAHIRLFKDNFELPVKREVFHLILQKIRESYNRSFISTYYGKIAKDLIRGKYRNNGHYYSIQNQFPKLYGIGREGLLASDTRQRKAQAKQLKGYLLFFEQIMADYLSQLSRISDIFSIDISGKEAETYYRNPLYDVPGVRPLFKAFTSKYKDLSDDEAWEAFKADKSNDYMLALDQANETDQTFIRRKNRFFEHLMARFNEFSTVYPIKLFGSLYDPRFADERLNLELRWKSTILKNIPAMGSGRVRAANYLDENNETIDFSARMEMVLHITPGSHRRSLTKALDPDIISVDQSRTEALLLEDHVSAEPEESIWLGDMPQLVIDAEEVKELFEQGLVITDNDIPNDAFLLKSQHVSVLRYALDIKNFRIGPDQSGRGGYILLYKTPYDERWTLASRFPTHEAGMKTLKNLIRKIRDINVNSEGFYVIEHILLRPDLHSKSFGFRFINRSGQKLMEHARWMTFEEREKVIGNLLKILQDSQAITPENLAPLCKINLYAPLSDVPDSDQLSPDQKKEGDLFNYFKLYAAHQDKFLGRLEMVVLGEDNSMIPEDFFGMNLTVIFPSWPARFQDKGFREVAESLFCLNLPAPVKPNFIWMKFTDLKKLESIYFDWKRFMSDEMDKETRNDLRNALVQMLIKY